MEHKLTQDEIARIKDGRAVLVDVRSDDEVAQAMLTKDGFIGVHNVGRIANVPDELCA